MKSSRLGCFTLSGWIAGFITLAVIAGLYIARGGAMFNPGPLNAQAGAAPLGGVLSHAETEGRCAACHPPLWQRGSMADRCLDCHSDLLNDPTGFHGVMLAQGQRAIACRPCHTDHRGAQAGLTVLEVDRFPHLDAAGFALNGHQVMDNGVNFTCQDCHGELIAPFELAACRDCHAQREGEYMTRHSQVFGEGCLDCHDGADRYGAAFDHNRLAFALQGGHEISACGDCHAGARTAADLRAAPQECSACHLEDDAHQGALGADCAACHAPTAWEEATFDHERSAFPLRGAHLQAVCAGCHRDKLFKGAPQTCFDCHAQDDEHGGQFGQDCAACHTPEDWEQVTFDHNRSAFPLAGKHLEVECEGCHRDNLFQGTPQACYDCHAEDDEHGGRFGQDCAACHTPETWEEATFDHALADFQLTGAHGNVACEDCHRDGVFEGTPQTCAGCHAGPAFHQGLFDSDCAACHDSQAWRPARFDRSHRFPINHGEGGASTCTTCHPNSLRVYTCYGCHEHTQSNIAGKHNEEGISDFSNCVRCHPTGREEEGGEGGDD
ncbi:MAG: hypothetical protein L0Z70_14365 [Chloroflexi bacterium]|nr:hypothetical protein [Chloroflexota bacterium]